MAKNILEAIKMIRSMVSDFSFGKMAKNTKEIGLTENSMGKELL